MSHPIKALVVISNLCHGGAERQVVELANRIDPTKVELHVCTLSDYTPLAEFLKFPDRLHIIQKQAKFDITVILKLAQLLKKEQFDVVHGFLYDAEIAARLAGAIARTKANLSSERNSNYTYGRAKRAIYQYTAVFMDMCVANSNAGAEFSHQYFNIPKSKYRVIHNGVDIDRFTPRKSNVSRDSLGIPDNAVVMGVIGSYKQQKNHPFLLRAAAKLAEDTPDFRIMFVGSMIAEGSEPTAEYYQHVQQEIDRLNLRDKMVLVEARNDIEEMFNLCDFTVLPSLFEGTPNVALESMACGVPVVATDVADNRFVIPDGKVGYIVPLNDEDALANQLNIMIRDHNLRKTLSANARKWVEDEFGLDKMANKFYLTYKEILDNK